MFLICECTVSNELFRQIYWYTCPLAWLLEDSFQKAEIVQFLDGKNYNGALTAKALLISPQVYYLIYVLLHLVSEASFLDVVNPSQRVSNFRGLTFRF